MPERMNSRNVWTVLFALLLLMSSCQKKESESHELLNAVLWMQHSAEYQASCFQAYNTAERMLEIALNTPDWTAALEQDSAYQELPPAIILDVDETVLDNSPYESRLILTNSSYNSATWKAWCAEQQAEAIAGAALFCQKAYGRGVTVFYVTNRKENVAEATRKNLQQAGFPFSDSVQTLRPRTGSSDKGPRRADIARNYRILLLIGDNNGDFASAFTGANSETRSQLAMRYRDYWGTKWIVLPNPAYGDWEAALYDYNYSLTAKEKTQLKRTALRME